MQSAGQLLAENTHQELYNSMLEITHKLDKVKNCIKRHRAVTGNKQISQ